MRRNISARVDKAIEEGKEPITDKEISILEEIAARYPQTNADYIMLLLVAVQTIGFGRNEQCAATLRAVADFIESPIPTAESIEARLDGKLQ